MRDFVVSVLTLVVAAISIGVTIFVAYDRSIQLEPERRIKVREPIASNPLGDLVTLNPELIISLGEGESTTLESIFVIMSSLENVGLQPIIPDDFHSPLSLTVTKPWRIIDVQSDEKWLDVDWQKKTDQEFYTNPLLLNPGEKLRVKAFVTGGNGKPSLKWETRIVNLKRLKEFKILDAVGRNRSNQFSGIVILIGGWELPLVLFFATLFFASYVVLLSATNIVSGFRFFDIAMLTFASLLSFSAAEVMGEFIFGPPTFIWGLLNTGNWINWVVLVLHILVLVALSIRFFVIRRASE